MPLSAWSQIKKRAENLARLAWSAMAVLGLRGRGRYVYEAETSIGLQPLRGRNITATGVKPKGNVPWPLKATYWYGIGAPATGAPCFSAFTHRNSDWFQGWLAWVREPFHASLRLLPLDQAGAPQAKRFTLPTNSLLRVQPSHAPETKPYACGGAQP